jgi:chemotaxis protein MotB
MAKRRREIKQIIEEGAPDWVVTFGDLMSLLLCFFVLMLSFSEMDRQKYRVMSGSMAEAFGVQRKDRVMEMPRGQKIIAKDFDQDAIATRMREELIREIRSEVEKYLIDVGDLVRVDSEGDRVIVRLMGETTFDSGRAVIRPQMAPLLRSMGEMLKRTEGEIIVAGHTDNVPISGGPYGSNLVLSMARAASVSEFLIAEAGVEPRRIAAMGYGEFRPLESNETAEGRRKNRRVEITLSSLSFQSLSRDSEGPPMIPTPDGRTDAGAEPDAFGND